MRVLAWVPQPYDTSPGQRFRLEQWEPYLREAGITLRYAPFMDEALSRQMKQRGGLLRKAMGVLGAASRRLREARSLTGYDLVYIYREDSLIGPAWPARVLAARGIPFTYDFDDAVWVNYASPANPLLSRLRFPGKTATYCRLARHSLAGNDVLRAYAESVGGRASVVPTTIETRVFRPIERPPNDTPVIGWTGSYSTERYLDLIAPALARLAAIRPFRFVVIGGGSFHPPGVEVEHRIWRSATEADDLRDLDVGLMPLPDDIWERGKCGCKALQYMALGIPPVVSPVGVNTDIVRDGCNGLLARTSDEWVSALSRLLDDADLRRRLGSEAVQTVQCRYAASVQGPKVARILADAAGAQRPDSDRD